MPRLPNPKLPHNFYPYFRAKLDHCWNPETKDYSGLPELSKPNECGLCGLEKSSQVHENSNDTIKN